MSNPEKTYDLHLHSLWSYHGECAVADFFEPRFRALRAMPCTVIAITDFNTTDGLQEADSLATQFPEVTFIRGVELRVKTIHGDRDLLCYGWPVDPPMDLQRLLSRFTQWSADSSDGWVQALTQSGIDFTMQQREELLAKSRPARVHALQRGTLMNQRALLKFINDNRRRAITSDEFDTIKVRIAQEFTPPCPDVQEVMPVLKRHGIVVVLAHPTGALAHGFRYWLDQSRAEVGYDGIECAHPLMAPEQTERFARYCEEHHLVPTAGSDSRERTDLYLKFGRHLGEPHWAQLLLDRLGR